MIDPKALVFRYCTPQPGDVYEINLDPAQIVGRVSEEFLCILGYIEAQDYYEYVPWDGGQRKPIRLCSIGSQVEMTDTRIFRIESWVFGLSGETARHLVEEGRWRWYAHEPNYQAWKEAALPRLAHRWQDPWNAMVSTTTVTYRVGTT